MDHELVSKARRAVKQACGSARATKRIAEQLVERAKSEFTQAAIAGDTLAPWVDRRVAAFAAMAAGGPESADRDLIPPDMPATDVSVWKELQTTDEKLAALAARAVEGIDRATARKTSVSELGAMHAHVAALYKTHFAGNRAAKSVSGLDRAAVLRAAGVLQAELSQRKAMTAQDAVFCAEVAAFKAAGEPLGVGVLAEASTGDVTLALRGGPSFTIKTGRAEGAPPGAWSPDGSRWHVSMRKAGVPYAVVFDAEDVQGVPVSWCEGATTGLFHEIFVLSESAAALRVGKSSVLAAPDLVPFVLTPEAVLAKWMPEDGESALPASIERDVPPEYRYWLAGPDDALELRDALVAKALFRAETVRVVDGELRRLTLKYQLDDVQADLLKPIPATASVLDRAAAIMPEALRGPHDAAAALRMGDLLLQDDATDLEKLTGDGLLVAVVEAYGAPDTLTARLSAHKGDLLVVVRDAPDALADSLSELGVVFKMLDEPTAIVVASRAPAYRDGLLAAKATAPSIVSGTHEAATKGLQIRALKNDTPDERYVLGVVLEPDVIDAQSDTYDEDTVRKSAYRFMEEYRNVGLMHEGFINEHVKILESYVAPVDFEVGDQAVKKGTWLLAVRVLSDTLWKSVKEGGLTGFSIGGSAIRTPEDAAS